MSQRKPVKQTEENGNEINVPKDAEGSSTWKIIVLHFFLLVPIMLSIICSLLMILVPVLLVFSGSLIILERYLKE
jgi:hypothetical protein